MRKSVFCNMENSFGVKSLLKGFFIRLDANLFLSFDLVYMGFEQILFAIYKNILALRKLSFAPDQSAAMLARKKPFFLEDLQFVFGGLICVDTAYQ